MDRTTPNPGARVALGSERVSALDRLRTLEHELAGLAGDAGDANGDDEHDPEGSTVAYERARVAGLLVRAVSHLEDVDRALEKLAKGRYSVCEGCGGQIPSARLEALPAARTCIGCASPPARR
jgi:RNA polymerase-binding transcription factor DksA